MLDRLKLSEILVLRLSIINWFFHNIISICLSFDKYCQSSFFH